MDGMQKSCLVSMAALFLALLLFVVTTWHYKGAYEAELSSHSRLAGEVRQQNKQAAAQLEQMTRERDEKQALLNQQAKEQEEKDAERLAEIERLNFELDARPVRVRIVSATGGSCGGGSAGEEAGPAQPGAGGEAQAYGLLPEQNSRRLGIALKEVETLSAAYNSCRDTLLRDYTYSNAPGGN